MVGQHHTAQAAPPEQQRSAAVRLPLTADVDGNDLRLVRRAQAGERGAFDALVLKYQPRILKLAMRYTRNMSDAEDVSQEAFIKAFRGLRHFRCECAFYTWLHRIATNSAKNVLMARAREPVANASEVPDAEATGELSMRLRELETPEDLTVTDNMRSMVNATLATLPDGHRNAIMLREIEGLTYEEIAATMAIPIGTVRSRVFRAREAIDRQLRRVFEAGLGRGGKQHARAMRAA